MRRLPHPGMLSLAYAPSHQVTTNRGGDELANERIARWTSSPSPLVSKRVSTYYPVVCTADSGNTLQQAQARLLQALEFPVPDSACHRLQMPDHSWRYNWAWNDTIGHLESRLAAPDS